MLSWDNFAKKKANCRGRAAHSSSHPDPPSFFCGKSPIFHPSRRRVGPQINCAEMEWGKETFFIQPQGFLQPTKTIEYVRKSIFCPTAISSRIQGILLRAEIRLFVSGSRRGSLAWHPPQSLELMSREICPTQRNPGLGWLWKKVRTYFLLHGKGTQQKNHCFEDHGGFYAHGQEKKSNTLPDFKRSSIVSIPGHDRRSPYIHRSWRIGNSSPERERKGSERSLPRW